MSPTIRHKYKYFHSTVQRAKDRRQKFHFCCLSLDVRPRNSIALDRDAKWPDNGASFRKENLSLISSHSKRIVVAINAMIRYCTGLEMYAHKLVKYKCFFRS